MDPLTKEVRGVPVARVRDASAATARRLAAASDVLGLSAGEGTTPDRLLVALVARVGATGKADEAWLVLTALTTVFPTEELIAAFLRKIARSDADACTRWLLGRTIRAVRTFGDLERDIRIVDSGVIVDVDFEAKFEHNSGIQRLVRRTVPRWAERHDLELIAWTESQRAWRGLSDAETARVLRWEDERSGESDTPDPRLVVPWRSTLVLAANPHKVDQCVPLRALARHSGNRMVAIGYDVIPTTSAETLPIGMSDHFAKYLSVVKYMDRVVAISRTAGDEFAAFAEMTTSQGLAGPTVVAVVAPEEGGPADVSRRERDVPLVLCVGNKEPRKNQVGVLAAAERLWRDGLDFEILFVGARGWDTRHFDEWTDRLKRAGRPFSVPVRVPDAELWQAYADARFTVFPSLHEGYGLPVVESLWYGTPAVVTGYGSTGEIAESGGCLTVDPRRDDELEDAMRRLLTDDDLLGRLQVEASRRPRRDWGTYADEAWSALMEPVV